MNEDTIRRILNNEPEPVTKLSCVSLQMEVADWIRNRESNGLDSRLLQDVQHHLSKLRELLNES